MEKSIGINTIAYNQDITKTWECFGKLKLDVIYLSEQLSKMVLLWACSLLIFTNKITIAIVAARKFFFIQKHCQIRQYCCQIHTCLLYFEFSQQNQGFWRVLQGPIFKLSTKGLYGRPVWPCSALTYSFIDEAFKLDMKLYIALWSFKGSR